MRRKRKNEKKKRINGQVVKRRIEEDRIRKKRKVRF